MTRSLHWHGLYTDRTKNCWRVSLTVCPTLRHLVSHVALAACSAVQLKCPMLWTCYYHPEPNLTKNTMKQIRFAMLHQRRRMGFLEAILSVFTVHVDRSSCLYRRYLLYFMSSGIFWNCWDVSEIKIVNRVRHSKWNLHCVKGSP